MGALRELSVFFRSFMDVIGSFLGVLGSFLCFFTYFVSVLQLVSDFEWQQTILGNLLYDVIWEVLVCADGGREKILHSISPALRRTKKC